MPMQPQSPQVRVLQTSFALHSFVTVCLYHGRFVPLKNLKHRLLSASQNCLSMLSTPWTAPVLGSDLGKAFKPTRKTINQTKRLLNLGNFSSRCCKKEESLESWDNMGMGSWWWWWGDSKWAVLEWSNLCSCSFMHHFAKVRHLAVKHLNWHQYHNQKSVYSQADSRQ